MLRERLLLALDFGGTKLSAATIGRNTLDADDRQFRALGRRITPEGADAAYEQAAMMELAHEMLDGAKPAAIGISFGGPADHATGTVRLSHHVAGWEETPLAALLADVFGAPVALDNDANVAALGEHRFGAGRGLDSLLYVTISTGVGGGWVLHGRPWRGQAGMVGELGHMVIDPSGPICLCGKQGCVERFASGPYMAQDATKQLAVDPMAESVLRMTLATEGTLTGRHLAEAATAGDDLACAILLRGARAIGVGLGNAANLINPQRIILGGGVAKSGPLWWDAVQATARATALPEIAVDIVMTTWPDDAPLWGAMALAAELLDTQP